MVTRRFAQVMLALAAMVLLLGLATSVKPVVVHADAATEGNAPVQAGASEPSSSARQMLQRAAQEQLDDLPTESITKFWTQLEQEYGGYLPEASGTGLIRSILDNGGVNFRGFTAGLLHYFFHEVMGNLRILGSILILAVLAAVLESMQTAFERQVVSQVAYAMIFLVLMILAIGSFTQAMGYAQHAIHTMTDFMLATVPLAVTLLAASGAPASAAFFHPVLLFAVHLISNLVFLLVFPLIFFAAVLDIASALSPRYRLTRLAGLLRTVGVGVLGMSLTVFLGIASVQGLGRGIADGVALRTAKFAVGTFVPVIGKALSDAAETVVSASLLVKNAVGIAGLVIVACIAVFPALKILALAFIYNGSAALMQPLGDNPMIQCLGALSKSLILVFASVAAVALMFFMFICILLAAANVAVVMA
ncbi:stage III sporulation protein AE [Alicyclobacillus kakegawensis]|uniref:stage III sporulation protein AE n=1 Tax=Alicyclobacillus kakegawensis TaxID=392012 RepID=UPI000A581401|nr:stage III sporulation protein AE [Alicyclobacillus kakegawensis]